MYLHTIGIQTVIMFSKLSRAAVPHCIGIPVACTVPPCCFLLPPSGLPGWTLSLPALMPQIRMIIFSDENQHSHAVPIIYHYTINITVDRKASIFLIFVQ